METNYNFCDHAPGNFSFCFKSECAMAGECLRALVARDINTERKCISVINPLLANPVGGSSCAYFRKAERVRVAYGFRKALAKIESGKVGGVRTAMLGLVCQRNYYYLLSGEKPIFPAMQRKIENILCRYGLSAPIAFDRYEWHYEWGT